MPKPKGWFSRRHATNEAHQGAQALRQAREERKKRIARECVVRAAKRRKKNKKG